MGLAVAAARNGSPYEAILGQAFASLHPHVRRAHQAPLRAEGSLDVEHGPRWMRRPLIWLMKLPAVGCRQPVRLDVVEDGPDLMWTRRIGRTMLRTRQHATGARLVERAGIARISFTLAAEDGALRYRQSTFHLAGVALPAALSPEVSATVSSTSDGWHVAVTVTWRGRLLCRYAGAIRPS